MKQQLKDLIKYADNDKVYTNEEITKQWNYLQGFDKETLLEYGYGDNGETQQYVEEEELGDYAKFSKDVLVRDIIEWAITCERDLEYKMWGSINPLLKGEWV